MIIDERDEYGAADLESPATGGVRVDHIAALSTVVGAAAIAVCFWDAVPRNVLAAWSAAAAALTILQWQTSRWPLLSRRESTTLCRLSGSRWARALAGHRRLTLSPAASLPHQSDAGVVLISVTVAVAARLRRRAEDFWLFAVPPLPMVYAF
jgi:hypothetical protein